MKPLAATLQAMKSPEDLPREPRHGLTTTGGQSIIAQRAEALTENQLTQIVSKTLQASPRLSLTAKKQYGRKEFKDEFGLPCVDENAVIGEEEVYEITIAFAEPCAIEFVKAALRASPASAALAHLKRLAMHKRLGSDKSDRTILLHDYADALRIYPEFIVYLACKAVWETHESDFCPKIKTLANICEEIHMAFRNILNAAEGAPQIGYQAPKRERAVKEEEGERGKAWRRRICDFILAKGGDDFFGMDLAYSNYQLERLASVKWGWTLEAMQDHEAAINS